jgi:hypothetical protein
LRLIIILTFLTFAFIVAESIFAVTNMSQIDDFQKELEEVCHQLSGTMFANLDNMLWVAKTFAGNIEDTTRSQNWPFVVLPDFEQECNGPLHLTNAAAITLSPKITRKIQPFWEFFASTTYQELVFNDSINGVDDDDVSYYPTDRTIQQGIYQFDAGVTSSVVPTQNNRGMFPIWQMSPRPPQGKSDKNMILGTLFDESSNDVRKQALKQMVNSTGCTVSNFLFQDTNASDLAIYGDPRSILYYPILDDNVSVVGSLGFQFEWDEQFENVLNSAWDEPVVVVLESSCGGVFSYEVQGDVSNFLGEGDLHDVTINEYTAVSSTYEEYAFILNEHITNQAANETSCLFRMTTYPTAEFKDKVRGPNL